METVHIITAISRPENVPKITESLIAACQKCEKIKFVWHWRFDIQKSGIDYAHKIKNEMVDDVQDGWIWILDDDTIVHDEMFLEFEKHLHLSADAFVFDQMRKNGIVLYATPENRRVDHIDSNQAILNAKSINGFRMTSAYNGDGVFLENVLKNANVYHINKILCYHNAL